MNVEDQAIRDGKMNGVYGVRNGVNAHIGARTSAIRFPFRNSAIPIKWKLSCFQSFRLKKFNYVYRWN